MAARSGEYRHQDYQILGGPHPQRRWDRRAPEDWRGYSVRSAWREAVDVDVPWLHGYCRVHVPSQMALACENGFFKTAIPLSDRDPREQRIVYEQLEGESE